MKFWKMWDTIGIYLFTLVVLIFFVFLTPRIISFSNIINLLSQTSMVAIAAAAMTFAITSGGFDLSVGSTLTLTTCILGVNIPIIGMWPTIIIALVVGVILGAFNGVIIAKLKIPTFVVTLATMSIYRGLALLYTNGKTQSLIKYTELKIFSSGTLLGIPVPIIVMAAVFVVFYLLYKRTTFGVYVRSIGSNETASRISGLHVDRVLITVYILTAVMTVVSGIIQTSKILMGNARYGVGFELEVITATIVGGTALAGGRGKIWGTLVAAIMLGIVSNGLNLAGLSEFYQKLAQGLVLLLVLSIYAIRELKANKI